MDLKEKKLDSENIYKGRIIDVYRDKVLCPNGNTSTREVVRHCEAVAIVCVNNEGKIIMEKQYRYPYDQVLIEIPAGKVDKGEDLKTAALRELEEETGFKANNIVYLGKIFPTVAFCDEVIHIYFASDLIKTKQHFDPDENLEIYFDDLDSILKMIKEGQIVDSKTIAGIMQYLLYIKK